MEGGSLDAFEFTQRPLPNFAALHVVDGIITHIYLPFRGQIGHKTERAILVEEPHVPHRENDAEHSWHLAFTCEVLYSNRENLGIDFGENFDIGLAIRESVPHDVPEIRSGDVDMTSPVGEHHTEKQQKELIAMSELATELPWLNGISELWHGYEPREKFESQFVSDIDKLIALRMICLDGGTKWHSWDNYTTSKLPMLQTVWAKLYTHIGKQLFSAAEIDIEEHPEYFPENPNPQGRLF